MKTVPKSEVYFNKFSAFTLYFTVFLTAKFTYDSRAATQGTTCVVYSPW